MLYKVIRKGLDAVDIRLVLILLLFSGVIAGHSALPAVVNAVRANRQIEAPVAAGTAAQAAQTDRIEAEKREKFIRTQT